LKNKQALIILFLANGVSGFAQGISMLSIPSYFTLNNQSVLFLIFFGIITIGSLFWGLYAGALIDGFNRKDVFLGTNFIEGLIVISVAMLGFSEVLPPVLIILVFTVTYYGYNIHFPNLYAFVQEVSDPKDYLKVTSYIEIVGQFTSMGSAAMGAMLLNGFRLEESYHLLGNNYIIGFDIPKWELHEIFLLDGITYIISFILIFFIQHRPTKNLVNIDEGDLNSRLKLGYDYLKKNPLVTIFGICSYSTFIIILVEIFCLLSLYIYNHLHQHPDVLGMSEFMYATGSLVSGFLIRKLLSTMPIPKSIIILTFLTTAAFFLCSVTSSVFIFFLISFVIGFTNAGTRIFRVSYLFKLIPNELTGRVNSIFNVINTLFRVFFILIFCIPFFHHGSNVTYAYLILGSFTLIAGIILLILYKRLIIMTHGIEDVVPATH
jgi:DHA3 family macrolide efflux protein-like MFS transporter